MRTLFKHMYQYRTFVEVMVGRQLKARYRGTSLGFVWSFLTPLLTMLAYVLVFSVYMRSGMPSYAAFLASGVLPWGFFASGVSEGADSLLANGHLIKKIYLPGEVFPAVSVVSNGVHFLLSVPVLLLICVWMGRPLGVSLCVLPLCFFAQSVFTYGMALVLCSFATQFRDIKHVLPNLMYIWFFLTPVVYSIDTIPQPWKAYASYNPMCLLITAYQDILYKGVWPSFASLGLFACEACVVLMLGAWVFGKRAEIHAEFLG